MSAQDTEGPQTHGERMLQLDFRRDLIAETAFIAPTAVVLGQVHIGAGVSIWFHAVVRGDTERIEIGEGTNVQDQCVLHADPGFPCVLGKRVTLGHGAIVHGATLEDDVLVGMRSVVMNGARIGQGSIIGVGAVVTEGSQIPERSLVLGIPGRVQRQTTDADLAKIRHAAAHYIAAAQQYQARGTDLDVARQTGHHRR